jgi:hypothetical protein
VPWFPSERSTVCDGIDLSGGVVCDDGLPVCNHGNTTAPSGIRIIHYPANSGHFPECAPEQLKSTGARDTKISQCFTTEPIPPGQCISVQGCFASNDNNREVMINPPDPSPLVASAWTDNGASSTATAPPPPWHIDECQCKDNWTLQSKGASCVEPSCSGANSEAVVRRVNLLLLVDDSSSMAGSLWTPTKNALKAFFQDPESAGLYVALEFFPLPAYKAGSTAATGDGCAKDSSGNITCSATTCANPMVPIGQLTEATGTGDVQETALLTALNTVTNNTGTPTYPALQGALNWAKAGLAASPNDIYSVVLLTDGAPSRCGPTSSNIYATATDDQISELALAAYSDYGIRTYTIGLDGSDVAAVDDIAQAGGTGSAFVISAGANVEDELISVFQSIRLEHARCAFELTNASAVDPFSASIDVTLSSGATTTLGRVDGAANCDNGGWYYDDISDPTKVTFCPDTCGTIEADDQAQVDLSFGCRRPYTETVVSETYRGTCGEDEGPQWGYLTYDVDIYDDSSVTLSLRTADTEEDLAAATYQDIAVIADGSEYPADCTMFGPAPCPIALFDALGGPPAALDRYIEVAFTLTPTIDQYTPAVLNNWNVTYSCASNE